MFNNILEKIKEKFSLVTTRFSSTLEIIKGNLRSVIIIVLLVIALVTTLVLLPKSQILKSRAESFTDILDIQGVDGGKVTKEDNTYKTDTSHIIIKIKKEALEQ